MKKVFPVKYQSLRILAICIGLFIGLSLQDATAQDRKPDVITLKDQTKVEALILEVSEKEVKYKKFGYQDGPTFTIGKETISSILYANGEIENISLPTEQYYDRNQPGASSLYQPRSEPATRYIPGNPRDFSKEQLKFNEKFCYGKATRYRKMGFTGVVAGSLLTVVGIILVNDGSRDYNSYGGSYYSGSSSAENKIAAGSFCVLAGLGGGITLTAIGFAKSKSYNKKAQMYGTELRKRDLSFLDFQPRVDVAHRTAGVSMSLYF